jgi:mono/diheme cytochrome c family protein
MTRPLFALCLLALIACTEPPPADATGEEIYQQVCSNCHGDDLAGGFGPAIGAGSNSAEQDDEFLVLTITRGRGRMPSFDSTLSDEQIARVVEYLRDQQQADQAG